LPEKEIRKTKIARTRRGSEKDECEKSKYRNGKVRRKERLRAAREKTELVSVLRKETGKAKKSC
jgi:hypothetical protein